MAQRQNPMSQVLSAALAWKAWARDRAEPLTRAEMLLFGALVDMEKEQNSTPPPDCYLGKDGVLRARLIKADPDPTNTWSPTEYWWRGFSIYRTKRPPMQGTGSYVTVGWGAHLIGTNSRIKALTLDDMRIRLAHDGFKVATGEALDED